MIGRDEELKILRRRWAHAQGLQRCMVLISSEPGIGKSRLLVAVEESFQGEPVARLPYFCSPHEQESQLYPIIRHLEFAAEFSRKDSRPIILRN